MKAYSQDLRDRVIDHYKNGVRNKSKLAKFFRIGRDTVREWINRFEATGDYRSRQGINCGRAFRLTDKAAILEYLAKNPDANAIEIRDAVFSGCPMSTWYDTLSRLGITYKKKNHSTNSGVNRCGSIFCKN